MSDESSLVPSQSGRQCLSCGQLIPFDDVRELTVVVTGSDKPVTFWAHRTCFQSALHSRVLATLERYRAQSPSILPPGD